MNRIKLYIVNNRIILILSSIIIFLIIGFLAYYFYIDYNKEYMDCPICEVCALVDDVKETNEYIYVDVKGFVNKPGVYGFLKDNDYRVNDLIVKAGGLKKGADTTIINLSMKLKDEMTINIYSQNEVNDYVNTRKKELEKQSICQNNKVTSDGCITNNNDDKGDINNKININTANASELQTLSGIGESKAILIVNYRQENGLFTKIEDIMNVDGIGESVFEKIKDSIIIE